MAKLSLAKLERHLYAAADILRREGMDAATYKDFIFGMLFLKRSSDVFLAARDKLINEGIRTLDPNLGKVVIYDKRAGYRSLSRQEATSRAELRHSALHFSVNCAGRLGYARRDQIGLKTPF